MTTKHVVSVRMLAEYACMSGGLVKQAVMASRLREGREGHRSIQELLTGEWQSEAPARLDVNVCGVELSVQGRADAAKTDADGVHVLEIKTTRGNPFDILKDDYPAHWAQAEIYAHIFCKTSGASEAEVILIYAGTSGGQHRFKRDFIASELEERFFGYARVYAELLRSEIDRKSESAPTLLGLRFPFETFREGQREMSECVYDAMTSHGRALIEAPTGIGKTAASLYGALKALGTGKITSVFYLTARTTGRKAAEKALELMRGSGLKIRSVTITAKEKCCFRGKPDCGACRYGDGYYDRRREALREAMGTERLDAESIEALARKHELCPFELALDLTLTADVIICDYNYVFDPRVRLKRHFDKKSGAGLLIDEAHNLPDRAREMYSASLSGTSVGKLRREIAAMFGDEDPLQRKLEALENVLTVEGAEYDALREVPEDVVRAASEFAEQAEKLRVTEEKTVEMMLDCAWFARTAQRFDEDCYRTLIRPEQNGHIEVRIWCFAPEKKIDAVLKRVGGAAMFSATLAPMDFYAKLLAVPDPAGWLSLESPFPRENLFVARLPVSVKFRDRAETMEQVCRAIHAMTEAHPGNYLACFPSHAYLTQAYGYYRARFPDERVICQQTCMSEAARAEFITAFERAPARSMVAFIVLGGVFAEGVDLPDDRLSGAAIVSTGIPQPNPECELLREFYDDGFEGGSDAAYTYPGFRRVLQAAGRVIRTENDRGTVLLIDQRYAAEKYEEIMPAHWRVHKITRMSALNERLRMFWGTNTV